MILADKIIYLRKKCGWSQEELAEKLGVSRQSVSKWEGAQSIPDLDKILMMSNIFSVSTDYLLKDEIEEAEFSDSADDDEEENIRKISMETASAFLSMKKKTAPKIALGVALCIASPVILLILIALGELNKIHLNEDSIGGIGLAVLIIMITSAVALFITSGIKNDEYKYLENDPIALEYGVFGMVNDYKKRNKESFTFRTVIGVCLCVLSPLPLFVSAIFKANDFVYELSVCVLLLMVATGVYFIVSSAIESEAAEQLLQEGDYTRKNKKHNKLFGAIAGIYWCSITAVYLLISFLNMNWDKSWIIWPVSAVFFAAIMGAVKLVLLSKEKN